VNSARARNSLHLLCYLELLTSAKPVPDVGEVSGRRQASGMSAVQDPAKERQREHRGGFPWPWSWRCPLFYEPLPLIAYVTGVLACYLAFTGWEAAHTPVTAGDFALFTALMCCGTSGRSKRNRAEASAPDRPSAALLNIRRYTAPRLTRR
jgi:hypothetical protein